MSPVRTIMRSIVVASIAPAAATPDSLYFVLVVVGLGFVTAAVVVVAGAAHMSLLCCVALLFVTLLVQLVKTTVETSNTAAAKQTINFFMLFLLSHRLLDCHIYIRKYQHYITCLGQ